MSKSTINTRHLTICVTVDSPFHWVRVVSTKCYNFVSSDLREKYHGEFETFDQNSIEMVVKVSRYSSNFWTPLVTF